MIWSKAFHSETVQIHTNTQRPSHQKWLKKKDTTQVPTASGFTYTLWCVKIKRQAEALIHPLSVALEQPQNRTNSQQQRWEGRLRRKAVCVCGRRPGGVVLNKVLFPLWTRVHCELVSSQQDKNLNSDGDAITCTVLTAITGQKHGMF